MRSAVLQTLVFVAGAAVAAAAQPQVDNSATNRVTVSGCVERADQVATASPTGQTVDTDSLSFVLMRATRGSANPAPVAAPTPTGTSGGSQASAGPSYWLDAPKETLNPHVGHDVEIQGTLTTGAAPRATGNDAPSLANAPRLKVDAIKMIGETCKR